MFITFQSTSSPNGTVETNTDRRIDKAEEATEQNVVSILINPPT